MIFTKFCTICNCEFNGEICPECEKNFTELDGQPKKEKIHKIVKPKKSNLKNEELQNKIVQLMKKYIE